MKGKSEFKHWCGNCQIRVYVQRHYNRVLTWMDCPYTCKYATDMKKAIKKMEEKNEETLTGNNINHVFIDEFIS